MWCGCWSLNSSLLIKWTDVSPVPYFCVLIDWICVCVLHTHIIYAYIHIYTIYIYSLENIYLNPVHIFLNYIFCFYCLVGLLSKSLQTLPSIPEHLLYSKNEMLGFIRRHNGKNPYPWGIYICWKKQLNVERSLAWWHVPLNPAFERQRQVQFSVFQASLFYINSRIARAT